MSGTAMSINPGCVCGNHPFECDCYPRRLLEKRTISFSVLTKFPSIPDSLWEVKDMAGIRREAALCAVEDPHGKYLRQSYFCIHTGDYLGEHF